MCSPIFVDVVSSGFAVVVTSFFVVVVSVACPFVVTGAADEVSGFAEVFGAGAFVVLWWCGALVVVASSLEPQPCRVRATATSTKAKKRMTARIVLKAEKDRESCKS